MTNAIAECEKLLGNARKATIGKEGLSSSTQLKSLIINELLVREPHQITRAILMKKIWMHYESSQEFDDIMQAFDAAGLIITSSVANQILYTMLLKEFLNKLTREEHLKWCKELP
jgi:hypothetical protein